MKQKGFTLIELLAVIVILAIIALIATPMILGVIDTAKRGSAESATLGYVEAVEKAVMLSQFTDNKITISDNDIYTVNGDTLTAKTVATGSTATIKVSYKGDAPEGTITFGADGSVTGAVLKFVKIIDKNVTYDVNASDITVVEA